MKTKTAAVALSERVTLVGVEGFVIKVLQADQRAEQLHLRHVMVREVEGETPERLQAGLKQMVRELDQPWGRCLLVVPRDQVFVRYALLPSHQPSELLSLATYQLHGELPFPIEEFVLACQPLAKDDAGTRVFIAAVHRSVVDGMIQLSKSVGFSPEAIVVSTEGTAIWAARLWQKISVTPPTSWAFAAVAGKSVELGVVVGGQLVYMRRVGWPEPDTARLGKLISETFQAYMKEPRGTPPGAVLVIGAFDHPHEDEQFLQDQLGCSVSLVNPASTQCWDEPMTQATLELLHEIEMTDMLGVATRPRQIALNLLPVEIQRERLQVEVRQLLRSTLIWVAAGVVGLVAMASAIGIQEQSRVRTLESRVAEIEPKARLAQAQSRAVGEGLSARRQTQQMLQLLNQVATELPSGMTVSTAMLESSGRLQIRGVAPSYDLLFSTVSSLSSRSGIRSARLKTASERLPGQVEYELQVEGLIP